MAKDWKLQVCSLSTAGGTAPTAEVIETDDIEAVDGNPHDVVRPRYHELLKSKGPGEYVRLLNAEGAEVFGWGHTQERQIKDVAAAFRGTP